MLVRDQLCYGNSERDLNSSCDAAENISADYGIDVLSHSTKYTAQHS